ncbi:translation repressor protein [uncultured Caudovirales phage]|jgi:hypothetical protein|uniref:Translation repressor protein n=1 Tax=uncultured Caudovirales phage TaxID=2100421 RepID=A0A6J5M4B2_9CAUD|nr:translation repressor protein [uncultured Caudovirales phage]
MTILDTLLEVRLAEEEDFLKIKETLTRIGVASKKEKKLYQSCHILHKRGKYYIVHFKELFLLDGKQSDFTEEDRGRRNTIAALLEEWNLFEIVDRDKHQEPKSPMNHIKILPHKEKSEWILESKHSIGKRRTNVKVVET